MKGRYRVGKATPMIRPSRQATSPNADVTKLAQGASVSFVGKLTRRGLQAISQVVLARLLGPEALGLYALGWTILRIAGSIMPLGLDKGVIRFASPYWRSKDHSGLKSTLFQSLGFALLLGLIAGGATFLAAPWLAERVFHKPGLTPILRWFALGFPLMAGLQVTGAATRVSQRMRYAVYTQDMGQPATNLILVLLFHLLGWGVRGASAAQVCSFGLGFALALYYVRQLFSEALSARLESGPTLRQLVAFSLPTTLAGLFVMLNSWTNRLFLGYFRPATEVGIYQAVAQSSILFVVVQNALNSILSPMIADLYHQKEMGRLGELYRVSTRWALYFSIPIFLTICFAPREMMTVVFGRQYAGGASPLVILAIAQLVNVGTGAVAFLLTMTGHQNRWLGVSISALVINVILNLLLIPQLGVVGAALATAGTVGMLFLGGLFQVNRCLKLWPYDGRYLKGLIATAIAVAALFLSHFINIGHSTISLLLTATVSAGLFGGTLLLLGLEAEDRELIRLVLSRFKKMKRI